MKPHARTRAEAKITVSSSEARPYDQASGPTLVEIQLSETFSGLGGREGTFVLQGSETVTNGKIRATWFVVPGSGTGDLAGLRGEGGFEGEFGKGSRGTLDYWFE